MEGFGGNKRKRKRMHVITYNLSKGKYYLKGEVRYKKTEITRMILTRGRF